MKAKSKVMLGLAAMLGVSAAVASYSTYAWFVTTRLAKATINKVGAKSNDGSLQLEKIAAAPINLSAYSVNDETATGSKGDTIAFDDASKLNIALTDVSSDGKNFYKPVWDATTSGDGHDSTGTTGILSADEIKDVTSGDGDTGSDDDGRLKAYITNDGLGYYKQFAFKLNNTGDNLMDVYVSKVNDTTPLIKLNETLSADAEKTIKGFRLAIISDNATPSDASDDSVVFYYKDDATDNSNYITATESTDDVLYGVEKRKINSVTGAVTSATLQTIVMAKDDTDNDQKIISELAKNASVTLTVSIWLEGESKFTDIGKMDGVYADFAFNLVAC